MNLKHARYLKLCLCLLWLPTGPNTCSAWQPQSSDEDSKETIFWIFLATGKSAQGVERSELEAMQAAHLANFRRLHEEGKLFAAGPLADPDRDLRGIVVVRAPDRDALAEMFESDPYVVHGYLKLETATVEDRMGEFGTPVEPMELEEWRLVVLRGTSESGSGLDDEQLLVWREHCNSLISDDHARLVLLFGKADRDWRAVLLFRALGDEKLNELMAELPPVRDALWATHVLPLYLGKGTVK